MFSSHTHHSTPLKHHHLILANATCKQKCYSSPARPLCSSFAPTLPTLACISLAELTTNVSNNTHHTSLSHFCPYCECPQLLPVPPAPSMLRISQRVSLFTLSYTSSKSLIVNTTFLFSQIHNLLFGITCSSLSFTSLTSISPSVKTPTDFSQCTKQTYLPISITLIPTTFTFIQSTITAFLHSSGTWFGLASPRLHARCSFVTLQQLISLPPPYQFPCETHSIHLLSYLYWVLSFLLLSSHLDFLVSFQFFAIFHYQAFKTYQYP